MIMMTDGLMLRILLISTILLLFYLRYRSKRRPMYEVASKMPGPRTFPIFGDVLTFAFHPERSLNIGMELIKKFNGSPIRFWFFNQLVIFSICPRDIEAVLNNMKIFEKPWHYRLFKDFMGKGLFTNEDVKTWRVNRKAITPAFHFNILKDFIPIFFEKSSVFAKKVLTAGKEVDVFTAISLCALDIICTTAMGVEVNSQTGKGKDFVHGMDTILEIAHKRLTRPWLMSDKIFNWSRLKKEHDKACDAVLSFTEDIIREKRLRYRNNNRETNDTCTIRNNFLDLMMSDGDNEHGMTDEQLRDETITILLGGQETTSVELTFALLMLALHQDVQRKVLDEVDSIFCGDKTRVATLEDLHRLEYLERVIKEVLRLYPAIPIGGRTTNEDIQLNGYVIPKGCTLAVFFYGTHRDPESYPNPDKFDPDNFLPERCRERSPFAFIPFSAGPRNCIGQKYAMLQLKTVLSTVLRHCRVSPGENMKRFEDVEIQMLCTIKSKKPVRLVFSPR